MKILLRILPIAVIAIVLFSSFAGVITLVLRQLNLYPPQQITIAAGKPGSAYYDYAQQYRKILARDDIELNIIETNGSVENASKMELESAPDLALVQGGISLPEALVGIASVQIEPLWVFARSELDDDPNKWGEVSLSTGAGGGGTQVVVEQLANITQANVLKGVNAIAMGSRDSASAIIAGKLDVAMFVAPAQASYLSPLFSDPTLNLLPLAHSQTIALRIPGARLIQLPSGALNYQRPLPETDLQMVALVTRLVGQRDIHPALVNRLVAATIEVHGGRPLLPADSHYPSTDDLGIDADKLAAKLFEQGFSPLESILPYWVVAQLNRILLIMVPLVLLLLPMMKFLPVLYNAIFNRRVYRHYTRLHEIDTQITTDGKALNKELLLSLRDELDEIELALLNANLPNVYRKQAYTVQHHLNYVRNRLDEFNRNRNTSGT